MTLYRYRYLIAFFIFSLIYCVNGYADTLYLKNKRSLEGIIMQEDAKEVVLDIGCGTVTISKGDIDRIERGTEEAHKEILKEWKGKYIETGRWVPDGAEDLFSNVKVIINKRNQVIETKQKVEKMRSAIESQQRELSEFYAKYEALNREFNKINKNNPFVYNKLVSEINATSARIGKVTNELAINKQQIRTLETEFSNCLNNYASDITTFRKYFEVEYAKLNKPEPLEENAPFYDWIAEEIKDWDKDFERREINFSKDNAGIVVSGNLNGRVNASFVVDTGASLVVITRAIARELDLFEDTRNKIELVLADGRKVSTSPVILDTVEVGGFKVRNVMAAVIDDMPGSNIDGLLGMSFLDNFLIKIDANANKLMLERFKLEDKDGEK